MAVITFSIKYPHYHPKKGQPTFFVEKFQGALYNLGVDLSAFIKCPETHMENNWWDQQPKNTTIRKGHRWKEGDYFSPRIWGNDINPKSGRKGPYHSKQYTFAPDTLITKTWDFEIKNHSFYINGRQYDGETEGHFELLETIAKNDGLTKDDLLAWFKFPKPFDGQIIAWNKAIEY